MTTAIDPQDMFTDGGSVPQMLWGIPGLSPWALGPAYIMHDWIFLLHRCPNFAVKATPQERAITFDQSALVLAQVGKALIETGLVEDNMLEPIVWAVRTRYARDLWEAPGTAKDCEEPSAVTFRTLTSSRKVIDFKIPPVRRQRI